MSDWIGKTSIVIFEDETLMSSCIEQLRNFENDKIQINFLGSTMPLFGIRVKSDGRARHQYIVSLNNPGEFMSVLHKYFMDIGDPFFMAYVGDEFPQEKLKQLYPHYPVSDYVIIRAKSPEEYVEAIIPHIDPSVKGSKTKTS